MIDWDSPAGNWYPVPGHPGHAVNESGQVLSIATGTVLTPWLNSTGYPVVRLAPSKRNRLVHKLVALVFYGPCPAGHEVRHLDGDRANPSAANLAYGTRSENMADRWAHGTHPAQGITECPAGHPLPAAAPGAKRECATCRAAIKARYASRQAGATVECDNCGRGVSKLNITRHKKTDRCKGKVTGRWQ